MNDPFNQLRETSWRRKLTPAEESDLRAWLAADAAARGEWEADAELSRVLDGLPEAPLSSNFTARVWRAIELESAAPRFAPARGWRLWRSFIPKTTFAALVLGSGLFSYHEARAIRRAQIVRSVATVSGVASLPGPEVLKDFDTIQQLSTAPPPDTELLALLK